MPLADIVNTPDLFLHVGVIAFLHLSNSHHHIYFVGSIQNRVSRLKHFGFYLLKQGLEGTCSGSSQRKPDYITNLHVWRKASQFLCGKWNKSTTNDAIISNTGFTQTDAKLYVPASRQSLRISFSVATAYCLSICIIDHFKQRVINVACNWAHICK